MLSNKREWSLKWPPNVFFYYSKNVYNRILMLPKGFELEL